MLGSLKTSHACNAFGSSSSLFFWTTFLFQQIFLLLSWLIHLFILFLDSFTHKTIKFGNLHIQSLSPSFLPSLLTVSHSLYQLPNHFSQHFPPFFHVYALFLLLPPLVLRVFLHEHQLVVSPGSWLMATPPKTKDFPPQEVIITTVSHLWVEALWLPPPSIMECWPADQLILEQV